MFIYKVYIFIPYSTRNLKAHVPDLVAMESTPNYRETTATLRKTKDFPFSSPKVHLGELVGMTFCWREGRVVQNQAPGWLAGTLSSPHQNHSKRCSRSVPPNPTPSLQNEGEDRRERKSDYMDGGSGPISNEQGLTTQTAHRRLTSNPEWRCPTPSDTSGEWFSKTLNQL